MYLQQKIFTLLTALAGSLKNPFPGQAVTRGCRKHGGNGETRNCVRFFNYKETELPRTAQQEAPRGPGKSKKILIDLTGTIGGKD
jgi:hypothetical protein